MMLGRVDGQRILRRDPHGHEKWISCRSNLEIAVQRAQSDAGGLGRPPRMPVTSRAALVLEFQGATRCALWITSTNFCRGLTVPNGGIRFASSIGTIVRSSAVVVGQRFERGVP
jgi:hypothetical protein